MCHYNLVECNWLEAHVEFQLGLWIFAPLESLKVKNDAAALLKKLLTVFCLLLLCLTMATSLYILSISYAIASDLYSIKVMIFSWHNLDSNRIIFHPQAFSMPCSCCTDWTVATSATGHLQPGMCHHEQELSIIANCSSAVLMECF